MVLDFNSLYRFPSTFERLFEDFWSPLEISKKRLAYPPVNIVENENALHIKVEVPGQSIEDIDLTLSGNSLVISGERRPEEGSYFRQERPTGNFQRVVNLNTKIDRENIKAVIKDGVLNIDLPKAEETKSKKISIESE